MLPLALYAAELGDFSIVKYIVEYSRASMNTVDENHRNILHYAAASGNLEMNRYLVEKVGMDITAGDGKCVTPYQIAYERKDEKLLSYYKERTGASYEGMYHNPIRCGMFRTVYCACRGRLLYGEFIIHIFPLYPGFALEGSDTLGNHRSCDHRSTVGGTG